MPVERTPPAYPIASVDSALRLLLLLREQPELRVAEAGEYLGVGRSTAHRLLAMLQYHGLIEQVRSTKAYVAGPVLRELGLAAVRQIDLRGQLRPHVEALRDRVGETAHLLILQGRDCLFVDSVESTRALRTASRVGMVLPAHCSAAGKSILAALPPDDLQRLYGRGRLPAMTDRSIATRAELERQLDAIRAQGYAASFGESEDDIAAVGAAVRDAAGYPRASIAVSAPLSRLTDREIPAIADAVVTAADAASRSFAT